MLILRASCGSVQPARLQFGCRRTRCTPAWVGLRGAASARATPSWGSGDPPTSARRCCARLEYVESNSGHIALRSNSPSNAAECTSQAVRRESAGPQPPLQTGVREAQPAPAHRHIFCPDGSDFAQPRADRPHRPGLKSRPRLINRCRCHISRFQSELCGSKSVRIFGRRPPRTSSSAGPLDHHPRGL